MRIPIALLAVCLAAAGIQPAAANEAGPPRFEMPRSEVRTIASKRLERTYDLYVKLPPGYESSRNGERRYPVIYLNDASYAFQTAAGVTQMPMNLGGLEHAILIGISYAKGERGMASRSRDLTPTSLGPGARYAHGGARDYLTFLRDEVIPFIEANYRADPARRTLVGQSYGGLFGAYAFLSEPDLFSGYILTSPSLWFDNKVIFEFEEAFAASNEALKARVYFAVGETETPSVNGGRHDMVGDQKRFTDTLRNRGYAGLEIMDEVIPGATHQSTFPIGLTQGMMWLHAGPDPYNGGARWYGN